MRSNLLGIFAIGVLACSGGSGGGLMRADVAAMARYTDTLVTSAGGKPGVGPCAMFGSTRAGHCTITRSAGEIRSLVDGKSLAVVPDATTTFYGDDTCAALPGFGAPNGAQRWDLLPGATRFVPAGTLPPNDHNVKLDAIVVAPNGTDVCFQFQFPYG